MRYLFNIFWQNAIANCSNLVTIALYCRCLHITLWLNPLFNVMSNNKSLSIFTTVDFSSFCDCFFLTDLANRRLLFAWRVSLDHPCFPIDDITSALRNLWCCYVLWDAFKQRFVESELLPGVISSVIIHRTPPVYLFESSPTCSEK